MRGRMCGCDAPAFMALSTVCCGALFIACGISAAVFTSRFVKSTYNADVALYNGAVTSWPSASANFRVAYPRNSMTATFADSSGVPLSASPALLDIFTGSPDTPTFGGSSDLKTYSTATNVRFLGLVPSNLTYMPWLPGTDRIDGELRMRDASSGAAFSVRLPLAFKATHGPKCTGSGKSRSCRCPGDSSSANQCHSYFRLSGVCLTMPTDRTGTGTGGSGSGSFAPAAPRGLVSPGCAPVPLISYLAGEDARIYTPQIDSCVALSASGMGVGQYENLGTTRPGSISMPSLVATVRSDADPWVLGMGLTSGTADFGTSEATLQSVSVGTWAAAGVAVLWLSCFCCVPMRLCRPCVEIDDDEKPIAIFCDDFDGFLSCIAFTYAGLFLISWIASMVTIGVAASPIAKQVTADMQLCSGGPFVSVGTGTMEMVKGVDPWRELYAFEVSGAVLFHGYIIGLMLLMVLLFPTIIFCNNTRVIEPIIETIEYHGPPCQIFFMILGTALLAVAASSVNDGEQGLADAYCDMLRQQGFAPTRCSLLDAPKKVLPAAVGVAASATLLLLCLGVCIKAPSVLRCIMNERRANALQRAPGASLRALTRRMGDGVNGLRTMTRRQRYSAPPPPVRQPSDGNMIGGRPDGQKGRMAALPPPILIHAGADGEAVVSDNAVAQAYAMEHPPPPGLMQALRVYSPRRNAPATHDGPAASSPSSYGGSPGGAGGGHQHNPLVRGRGRGRGGRRGPPPPQPQRASNVIHHHDDDDDLGNSNAIGGSNAADGHIELPAMPQAAPMTSPSSSRGFATASSRGGRGGLATPSSGRGALAVPSGRGALSSGSLRSHPPSAAAPAAAYAAASGGSSGGEDGHGEMWHSDDDHDHEGGGDLGAGGGGGGAAGPGHLSSSHYYASQAGFSTVPSGRRQGTGPRPSAAGGGGAVSGGRVARASEAGAGVVLRTVTTSQRPSTTVRSREPAGPIVPPGAHRVVSYVAAFEHIVGGPGASAGGAGAASGTSNPLASTSIGASGAGGGGSDSKRGQSPAAQRPPPFVAAIAEEE